VPAVFGDARPGRIRVEIWVAAPVNDEFICARCHTSLDSGDVAIFSKTRPGDPYDPWCPECAHQLVSWAGRGALVAGAFDTEAAARRMEEAINRGGL
jgi:hypothetical protein